jgi:DNA-directed RNA polymerase specialized sigma24 family protein
MIKKPIKLKPLSRHNKAGGFYSRTPEVEVQIKAALEMDLPALLERAQVRNHTSPNFFQEECLVYLIREYQLQGDDRAAGALSEILLGRCANYIRNKFLSFESALAREAFDETVEAIYDNIINIENDKGDFLQVRFWDALKKQAITTFRKFAKKQHWADKTVSLSQIGDPDPSSLDEDHSIVDRASEPITQELSEEERSIYREGLEQLNGNERTAFVLLHFYQWPIESLEKREPTISGYFKKTPRTIRNWIASAEKKLRSWREGVK